MEYVTAKIVDKGMTYSRTPAIPKYFTQYEYSTEDGKLYRTTVLSHELTGKGMHDNEILIHNTIEANFISTIRIGR